MHSETIQMTNVDVTTKVSRRFALDRLHVSPDLVGAAHLFVFERKNVTVRLPSLESAMCPSINDGLLWSGGKQREMCRSNIKLTAWT